MREHSVKKLRVIPSDGLTGRGAEAVALFNPDGSPYSPGGGSGFDHLIEDVDNFVSLLTDLDVTVSSAALGDFDFNADEYVNLSSSGAVDIVTSAFRTQSIGVRGIGDTYTRFRVDKDGSAHFGNGTDAPDAHIRREIVGGKIQLIATVGATEVVLATQP